MHVLIKKLYQCQALKSIHCEWSGIHGTVDLAANTPSSNLSPGLCAHRNWAGNSFYSIDHTNALPIVLSMISIAVPRDDIVNKYVVNESHSTVLLKKNPFWKAGKTPLVWNATDFCFWGLSVFWYRIYSSVFHQLWESSSLGLCRYVKNL